MKNRQIDRFFSEKEEETLVKAIKKAELETSGEIRVHLQQFSKKTPYEMAVELFEKLGMVQTKERNGILFFLSLQERELVILGDRGIHEKVGDEFWVKVKTEALDYFRQDDFVTGLVAAIQRCGRKLSRHFPRSTDDKNELSDSITQS